MWHVLKSYVVRFLGLFWFFYGLQVERAPKKHVVEEFEEFDYSDLYDDISVSTVTAGPNVTEYEVRVSRKNELDFVSMCVFIPSSSLFLSLTVCLCACLLDRS